MTKVLHSDFGAKLMPRSVPTHLHYFTTMARIIHNVIHNLVTMTTVIHSVVTRCESLLLLSLSQHQNQSMRIIEPFLVSFRLFFFFSTDITPFANLLFQFVHEFPKLIGCEWKFLFCFRSCLIRGCITFSLSRQCEKLERLEKQQNCMRIYHLVCLSGSTSLDL